MHLCFNLVSFHQQPEKMIIFTAEQQKLSDGVFLSKWLPGLRGVSGVRGASVWN